MAADAFLISVPASRAPTIREDASVVRSLIAETPQDSERRLGLDEAWAALHFTLTGEPPIPRQKAEALGLSWDEQSLENVIMGGDATPFQAAYGPARYLYPAMVGSMAERLSKIDSADFRARIDPQAMVEERMLPESWDTDTARQHLAEYFIKLKHFYGQASGRGDGILIVFT